MRVEDLQVIPYSLPFRDPYVTARGELRERHLLLIRVRADGLEGLGETAALSLRGGPGIDLITRQLRELCWPVLLGAGFDPDRIWSTIALCRSRGASAQALSALDLALHDLAGKASGQPVWRLLGAPAAEPVVCNATLPAANPTATRAMADEWAAAGFRTFKLKVGLPGDLTQVAVVRQVLGPEVAIRVDANGAWTVDQGIERLRAMEQHMIELAEEPVGGLAQMAQLKGNTDVPLAADESLIAPRDAREAIELDACDVAAVKLAKVGGISAALEIAHEIPIYLSSALEGPVAITAAAHTALAVASRGLDTGIAHGLATERLFAATIGSGVGRERDTLRPTDLPGLGVEIDEDALATYRTD